MKKRIITICVICLLAVALLAFTACGALTQGVTGIKSIEKTGTEGLVDTYTITLTNGETSTFTVTNGRNGTNGSSGGTSADPNADASDCLFFSLLDDDTYEVYARYCDMPKRVVIPSTYNGKTVTKIADDFGHLAKTCTNRTVEEIIIPDTVTSIGGQAFPGYWALRSITIPNSVTSIGGSAFWRCTGLISVTIPNSVTSIEYGAFGDCSSLKDVYYTGNLKDWFEADIAKELIEKGRTLYIDGKKLEGDIVIPNGTTIIPDYAFKGYEPITSVTIPDGVTSIGNYAFAYCTGLTSITIPEGVTSIGRSTFEGCSGLTSITYEGTKAQWNGISKGYDWNYNTGNYTIHCTDGDIAKS